MTLILSDVREGEVLGQVFPSGQFVCLVSVGDFRESLRLIGLLRLLCSDVWFERFSRFGRWSCSV